MCWLPAAFLPQVQAQHESFIFGEVTLVDNQTYTGQIRWSGGQLMWGDILQAKKKETSQLKYLSKEQLEKFRQQEEAPQNYDWGFLELWKNHYPSHNQDFKCRFGDMAALQITGQEDVLLVLKNGARIQLGGNNENNHLGYDILVYDQKKGKVKIGWEKISKVQFQPTPANLPHIKGDLLYGTIQTTAGSFSGLIRWDEDEVLSSSSLNGKNSENEDAAIRYNQIRKIEARDKGVMVTLHSGEQVFLWGKSNVNFSNHGIIVQHPLWGNAFISWSAFRSVVFSEPAPGALSYNSYPAPKPIKGTVRTAANRSYKCNLVYGLLQQWNMELLEGNFADNSIYFQFPFRHVLQLQVRKSDQSEVALRDGKKLVLGNQADVSSENWGLLLCLPQNKHQYIPWNKLSSIVLE